MKPEIWCALDDGLIFPIEWETWSWSVANLKEAIKKRTELPGPVDRFRLYQVEMKLDQDQILEEIKSQIWGKPLPGYRKLSEVFTIPIAEKVLILVRGPERESFSSLRFYYR